jgi:hypothetical protein
VIDTFAVVTAVCFAIGRLRTMQRSEMCEQRGLWTSDSDFRRPKQGPPST